MTQLNAEGKQLKVDGWDGYFKLYTSHLSKYMFYAFANVRLEA